MMSDDEKAQVTPIRDSCYLPHCPRCGCFCDIVMGQTMPDGGRKEYTYCNNCGFGTKQEG